MFHQELVPCAWSSYHTLGLNIFGTYTTYRKGITINIIIANQHGHICTTDYIKYYYTHLSSIKSKLPLALGTLISCIIANVLFKKSSNIRNLYTYSNIQQKVFIIYRSQGIISHMHTELECFASVGTW